MSYEDSAQQGLRPGRSTGTLAFDRPAPNNKNTAYSGGGSYRASGAVSPNYVEPAAAPSTAPSTATGADAISQYTAPQYTAPQFNIPKQPGLVTQLVGLAVADQASKYLGGGIGEALSYIGGSEANPHSLIPSASSSSLGLNYSTPASLASAANPYSLASSGSSSSLGLKAPGLITNYPTPTSSGNGLVNGLQTAGLAFGAGKVATALGANEHWSGAASGAMAGFRVGGPVGGAIGAVIGAVTGGTVICTELVLHGDATINALCREALYVKTLPNAVVRGYRVWGVPLVRVMRKHSFIYKLICPVAKRFMQESAARIGFGKQTLLGRIAMPIGLGICWMIGQVVGETEYKSLYVKGI